MRKLLVFCAVIWTSMSISQESLPADQRFSNDNEIVRVARLREVPELKVFLFPNPCFGELTVQTDANAVILIMDEAGREVSTAKSDEDGKAYVADLLTGVYYVVAVSEKRRALTKLVVL